VRACMCVCAESAQISAFNENCTLNYIAAAILITDVITVSAYYCQGVSIGAAVAVLQSC
jgi:hypothetical protein